jgi:protein SCO1/2
MKRYLPWIGIGVLAVLLLTAAVIFTRPYAYHGSVIQQPYPAPDFTLPHGQDGQFSLSGQRGRVVLIFFGYTHCPDVCPTTLATYKQIHDRLGKDAERVAFVFITVDPARDTPEVVARYAAAFNPAFTGLSGDEQQLASVWKDYGVYHKIVTPSNGSSDRGVYTVEHSSQTYLVAPDGSLFLTYSYGAPVDDILQDLRQLLK